MTYPNGSRVTDKLTEIDVAIQETNDQLQALLKKRRSLHPKHSPGTNVNSNV